MERRCHDGGRGRQRPFLHRGPRVCHRRYVSLASCSTRQEETMKYLGIDVHVTTGVWHH